jgi:threonine aldolase
MAEEITKVIINGDVGDDEYFLDKVVKKLEKKAANITGKQAALFVPSGLMANQIAVMVHSERTSATILKSCKAKKNNNYKAPVERGGSILLGYNSHIATWEAGAASFLSGAVFRTIKNENDMILPGDVTKSYREPSIWYPPAKLLCLENPLINGRVVPTRFIKSACKEAKEKGIPIHLDGARIFNAATRLLELKANNQLFNFGIEALSKMVAEIVDDCDSLMFCLSKGLASPVGSMLCGSKDFILKARSYRKLLGGGMRQAGVLAACGIISLDVMAERLYEDHVNARYMARKLYKALGDDRIEISSREVETNMVFCKFKIDKKKEKGFVDYLRAQKIEISGADPNNDNKHRFVTHNDVTKDDIDRTVDAIVWYIEN